MNNHHYSPNSSRTHIYYPDGRGRDNYIYSNNGGNYKTPCNISPSRFDLSSPSHNAKYYSLK